MCQSLSAAYTQCELVVKKHSSSFYRAFSVLPEKKRNAVWAVYAFCRTVDDIVDETPEEAPGLLRAFEADFERMLAGNPGPEPHWIALADVFSEFRMEETPFRDMIAGQRQDLVKVRYATWQELEHYCYLVAGTVGLMLLPILSPCSTEVMKAKAVKLGTAMQLTNILRDVKEDYERGRIYLPQELMEQFGYGEQEIPRGLCGHGWEPMCRHVSVIAEQLYQEGLSAQPYYPRDGRLALSAAGLIYREILQEILFRQCDVFSQRVFVSNLKKVSILLSLLTQASTWRRPRRAVAGESRLSW